MYGFCASGTNPFHLGSKMLNDNILVSLRETPAWEEPFATIAQTQHDRRLNCLLEGTFIYSVSDASKTDKVSFQ